MNTVNKTSRILGVAFLFQFVTSIISTTIILPQASGLTALSIPENIAESLIRIANHPRLMMANILGEMFTALGIAFLGVMLFMALKKYGEKTAMVALGFYLVEAAILAISNLEVFSLLRISQAYVAAGQPEYLITMGEMAIESAGYGYTLHTLPFAFGAVLFYYLLYFKSKSDIVPRAISLWGLITILPFLVGVPLSILGYEIPIFFYLPYVPFELIIGVWILFKGFKDG